mmetsp:Transcript_54851/g.138593  ORF Transcript_54851/g.138593 Transcript_54851/m.138593 type:complete len:243 (-) Transcript_54851:158-886(-)
MLLRPKPDKSKTKHTCSMPFFSPVLIAVSKLYRINLTVSSMSLAFLSWRPAKAQITGRPHRSKPCGPPLPVANSFLISATVMSSGLTSLRHSKYFWMPLVAPSTSPFHARRKRRHVAFETSSEPGNRASSKAAAGSIEDPSSLSACIDCLCEKGLQGVVAGISRNHLCNTCMANCAGTSAKKPMVAKAQSMVLLSGSTASHAASTTEPQTRSLGSRSPPPPLPPSACGPPPSGGAGAAEGSA